MLVMGLAIDISESVIVCIFVYLQYWRGIFIAVNTRNIILNIGYDQPPKCVHTIIVVVINFKLLLLLYPLLTTVHHGINTILNRLFGKQTRSQGTFNIRVHQWFLSNKLLVIIVVMIKLFAVGKTIVVITQLLTSIHQYTLRILHHSITIIIPNNKTILHHRVTHTMRTVRCEHIIIPPIQCIIV